MSDKFIPTRLLHCVGFQHSVSILLLNSDKESRKIIIRKGLMDKKKFHSFIRYIILIAVFVAAFFLLRYFFSKDKTETYTPPVSPVEVVLPEVREIDEGITLTGYIEPDSIIPVVPFVSGTIEEYSINAGDSVTEGDILATIDKRPYELQLRQAEAQVKALKALKCLDLPLMDVVQHLGIHIGLHLPDAGHGQYHPHKRIFLRFLRVLPGRRPWAAGPHSAWRISRVPPGTR